MTTDNASDYTNGATIEIGDWVVCTDRSVAREDWEIGQVVRLHEAGLHSGRIRIAWDSGTASEESYLRVREWTPYTDRASAAAHLAEMLAG